MPKSLAFCWLWTVGSFAAALAVSEPHLVADLGTELSYYAGSAPHLSLIHISEPTRPY